MCGGPAWATHTTRVEDRLHFRESSMRIDGTFSFNANPEKVWDVLLDPEALKACIPGCQSMTLTGENTYVITLTVGIAQFKGTYDGNVSIQDAQRPDHYEIHVDGKGRSEGRCSRSVAGSCHPRQSFSWASFSTP
ncbi:MAG: hypothetical protein EBT47_05795 [Chloroflexi bacterium]|nr:hypothetical protein [Chloroflexota bacterium]